MIRIHFDHYGNALMSLPFMGIMAAVRHRVLMTLPLTEDVLGSINTDAVENVVLVQYQATLVRQYTIGLLLIRQHDIVTDGTSRHYRRRGENRPVVLIRSSHCADLFMWIKSLEMYKNIILFRRIQALVTRCRTQRSIPYTDLNGFSPIMLNASRSVFACGIALTNIKSIVRVAGVERWYLLQTRLVLAMCRYKL
jgi:hypothetical protein